MSEGEIEEKDRGDTLILPSTPKGQVRRAEPDSEERKSTEQLDLDRVVVVEEEEPPKKKRKSTKRRITYGTENRSPNKSKFVSLRF